MISAILGIKIGMTQTFDESGTATAVTAVSCGPCVILGWTEKNVRLGYEEVAEKKVKKPQLGMFKKLSVSPRRFIKEVENRPLDKEIQIGQEVRVDIFKNGDFVDVSGITIGKGFQGGMKRWNWSGGGMSHGSMSHRRTGSMGSNTTPGRVFKGHHLHGHMGNNRSTIQNLKIIRVDAQNNILLIKGNVPGHKDSLLVIKMSKKKQSKA